MKIIKPLAGGFIIGEIFPKFRIGLLRDHENYSRWWQEMQIFWNLRLATICVAPWTSFGRTNTSTPASPPLKRGMIQHSPYSYLASLSTRGILRHLPNFVYLSLFWFPLVEGKPQQSREQHRESGARGSSKQQKTPTREGRSNFVSKINQKKTSKNQNLERMM
jgi:hypothetical protein